MDTKNYLTVRDVATRLGVSKQRVHQLIRLYAVVTSKFGNLVVIEKKELRKIPRKRSCSTRIRKNSA
jgi:hypothetical protein